MRNRASRGLPQIDFTPYDLQVLEKAIALFSEALARNNKSLPNMNLAAHSLNTIQEKIQALLGQDRVIAEFDFNEIVVIITALTMHQVDTAFFAPNEATPEMLKSCQGMIAYFTAIQGKRQPD